MSNEIIDYFINLLNSFLQELSAEIESISTDNPVFLELEEMNLHTLFFLSICQKIQTLPSKEQQNFFNEIYPELYQFSNVIHEYQSIR
jgi:hypothetical protein